MPRVPHVLIVDDDREIRRLVLRFLTENGLRATAVADAAEADAALGGGGIDLVVLDLMLPGEDGLSFARRLRQSSAVPILMLTARGDPADRIAGLVCPIGAPRVRDKTPAVIAATVAAELLQRRDAV